MPAKFFFLTKNFLLFDGIVENMQVENNEGEKNYFLASQIKTSGQPTHFRSGNADRKIGLGPHN